MIGEQRANKSFLVLFFKEEQQALLFEKRSKNFYSPGAART
jgi:hypothetical protein